MKAKCNLERRKRVDCRQRPSCSSASASRRPVQSCSSMSSSMRCSLVAVMTDLQRRRSALRRWPKNSFPQIAIWELDPVKTKSTSASEITFCFVLLLELYTNDMIYFLIYLNIRSDLKLLFQTSLEFFKIQTYLSVQIYLKYIPNRFERPNNYFILFSQFSNIFELSNTFESCFKHIWRF